MAVSKKAKSKALVAQPQIAPSVDVMPQDDQVTASIVETDVSVAGLAPAMAESSRYHHSIHATCMMFESAVAAQNNGFAAMLTTPAINVKQSQRLNTITDIIGFAKMLVKEPGGKTSRCGAADARKTCAKASQ